MQVVTTRNEGSKIPEKCSYSRSGSTTNNYPGVNSLVNAVMVLKYNQTGLVFKLSHLFWGMSDCCNCF
jgi:hypothetical protein